MGQRLDLHEIFTGITTHVYFQPPSNLSMKYPCIVYNRDFANTHYADNSPYRYTDRYMVTVIDSDPDSAIPHKIARLPLCSYNRFYTADNLNHDVFTLFF